MARCLRCGAGSEWLEGKAPPTQNVGSPNVLEAHRKLIALAGAMAQGKGLPSPYLADHIPMKLSKKAQRYFETQLEIVDEKAKLWALELRKIADSLASNAAVERRPESGDDKT